MDFDFNINNIFPDEISLIGKWHSDHTTGISWSRRDHEKVRSVIDDLGKRSAKAQNLPCQITSLTRAEYNRHRIYLLKDKIANNGHGSVLGFIKVGRKQLFLLDCDGNQNEITPLCVLDFYVHESKQRQGCGLRLFRFMLNAEKVQAHDLAIDKPSHKFLSFLRKHFSLCDVIPQVNNFVVFEKFFENNSNNRHRSSRSRDYFRPLSRATSDINPGRHYNRRQSPVSQQHHQYERNRPFSNTDITTANNMNSAQVFPHRNVRRRKWEQSMWGDTNSNVRNHDRNLYSRYSHMNGDGNNGKAIGLPPVPQIQRYPNERNVSNDKTPDNLSSMGTQQKPPVNGVVTNGTTSQHSSPQKTVVERPSSRLSISREVGKNNTSPHPRPPSGRVIAALAGQQQPNNNGMNGHAEKPLVPHPPARKTFSSNSTPDIILEMQKKDKLALLSAQQNSFYSKHKKLNSNSAWNLFGVPTIPSWYK